MSNEEQTLRDVIRSRLKDHESSVSAHYEAMPIEPWDVIDCWSLEQQVGYHRGNILKYTMRMGSKDDRLKEAKKIKDYATKLVKVLENIKN
jgi:hypothetical protein